MCENRFAGQLRAIDVAVFCLLTTIAVASRLLVDVFPVVPPNFHAVTAAAMFAGFYFRQRAVAVAVPIVAMMISDRLIGGYEGEVMVTVYASLVLPVALRSFLRGRFEIGRVTASALFCSAVFFVTTNMAVWHCWYAPTLAGMARCYTAALPFFIYTIAGDLCYSVSLFAVYRLFSGALDARRAVTASALAPVVAPAAASL